MQKLDDEAAAKFITALSKSVQTLCHGFLDFHNGIEIIGYIHLNVDKGSNLHYVLEEKVCKNEENSTLFISNSFQAQNQKQDTKGKGKDTESVPSGKTVVQRSNSTDSGETGKVSSAISSISSALSRSHEKSRTASTSSTKETDTLHSRPVSSTAKRKASDDLSSDIRSAKSSHLSSSPSPVSHFLTHSPHEQVRRSSPIDAKPSLSELRNDESSGTVLPQTASIGGDSVGDIGVNLAGSVLERVDDQSNSDLPDRGDDSDGDLEVTFIKEEYVEGEQSSCQFENSSGQQHYGRSSHQRASSSENMPDASLYPVSIHPSASATYVPSAQDIAAAAQHYGPSTSSQPQPGTSGVRGDERFQGHQARGFVSESMVQLNRKKQDENIERQNKWALSHFKGAYPPESIDSSACDQKMLEATQLFRDWLVRRSVTDKEVSMMSLTQLDHLLCSFYQEVRKKDGKPLKEHVMKRVRTGLMKYLSILFKYKAPSPMSLALPLSNKVYIEMLSKQPAKPTLMLTREDCTFLRGHKALGTDNPVSLLRKVWFELQIHFGARRWSPREMWPELFVFINNDDDDENVILDVEQLNSSSHLKFDVKHMLARRQMKAIGGPLCPVNALKLYLTKRTCSSASSSEKVPFLQKPNSLWSPGSHRPWYTAAEISLGKNHGFIRELCEEVKLSNVYTNMSLCVGDVRQYTDCWPQTSE